jgi:HEAT repeat protein
MEVTGTATLASFAVSFANEYTLYADCPGHSVSLNRLYHGKYPATSRLMPSIFSRRFQQLNQINVLNSFLFRRGWRLKGLLATCCLTAAIALACLFGYLKAQGSATIAEQISQGDTSEKLTAIQSAVEAIDKDDAAIEALIDPLRSALTDSDLDVKAAAIRAIGACGPAGKKAIPDVILQMRGIAGSSDGQLLWDNCGRTLAAIGPDAIDPLLMAIDSDQHETFKGCCLAFHELGPRLSAEQAAPIVKKITPRLLIEKETRRWAIAYALMNLGPHAAPAVPNLIEMLKDEDFQNVIISCQVLANIGPDAAPAADKLMQLMQEGITSERGHAALALGAIGKIDGVDSVAKIVALLEDSSQTVRERAMAALGRMGPAAKDALKDVEAAFDDDAFVPKAEAAFAHYRISGDKQVATARLIELLKTTRHEIPAIQKLGEMQGDAAAAVEPLLQKLASEDESIQFEVCQSLGDIGVNSPKVRAALSRLTKTDDEDLNRAASIALKKLDQKK